MVLGDPSKIKCKAEYITDQGTQDEQIHPLIISAADLDIEPIDLLFMNTTSLSDDAADLHTS